jgi:hypothetical protein
MQQLLLEAKIPDIKKLKIKPFSREEESSSDQETPDLCSQNMFKMIHQQAYVQAIDGLDNYIHCAYLVEKTGYSNLDPLLSFVLTRRIIQIAQVYIEKVSPNPKKFPPTSSSLGFAKKSFLVRLQYILLKMAMIYKLRKRKLNKFGVKFSFFKGSLTRR